MTSSQEDSCGLCFCWFFVPVLFAIGIIKDEFVAFCEGLKLCYDDFLRPEETLTHPQKLWMHSTTDFLLAFASKVPLKNVVFSPLKDFCIFTISTFECS